MQCRTRQSHIADIAPGVQFAAIVYGNEVKTSRCPLANTLEIYEYLLQHGAAPHLYCQCHNAHYVKNYRCPQNQKYIMLSEDRAKAIGNTYRKFLAIFEIREQTTDMQIAYFPPLPGTKLKRFIMQIHVKPVIARTVFCSFSLLICS